MAALREDVPPYDVPMVASRSELPYGAPLSERVEFLFQRITDPILGSEYTNADIACASEKLTVPEVAAIRDGENANPTLEQLMDLAYAFGVSPSYFTEDKPPLISSETARILLTKVRGLWRR